MSSMLMFFEYFTYQALREEYLRALFKLCPSLCYQVNYENVGKNQNRVTL